VKSSSRYSDFATKYGDRAHELEALPAAGRPRLLTEAINGVPDVNAYDAEKDAEGEDARRIERLRARLKVVIDATIKRGDGA
jgi:hypothetical protein